MNNDWAEIKRLADDLNQIQNASSIQKFSKQNCIDLISKLESMDLLKLIHTIDGQEFLTEERLLKEIEDELMLANGRISINQLYSIIRVSLFDIQNAVQKLLEKHPDNWIYISGEIVTTDYIDMICEEINVEINNSSSSFNITHLATNYKFSSGFLLEKLKSNEHYLNKEWYISSDDELIYSKFYFESLQATLLGALEATMTPIKLVELLPELKRFKSEYIQIIDIIKKLMKRKMICGELSNDPFARIMWTPERYIHYKYYTVEKFFDENGRIDFARLKKMGIPKEKEFIQRLQQKYDDIIVLKDSTIRRNILMKYEIDIEDLMLNEDVFDIKEFLSQSSSFDDADMLIQMICQSLNIIPFKENKLTEKYFIVNNQFVISKMRIDDYKKLFEQIIQEEAKKNWRNPSILKIINQSDDFTQTTTTTTTTTKRGGKNRRNQKNQDMTYQQQLNEIKLKKELFVDKKDENIPEEFSDYFIEFYMNQFNSQYFDEIRRLYKQSIKDNYEKEDEKEMKSTFPQRKSKKEQIKSIQNNFNENWYNYQFYRDQMKNFFKINASNVISEEVKNAMMIYIIKNVGNRILSNIFTYAFTIYSPSEYELNDNLDSNQLFLKIQERDKVLLKEKDHEYHGKLLELNKISFDSLVDEKAEKSWKNDITIIAKSMMEILLKGKNNKIDNEMSHKFRANVKKELRDLLKSDSKYHVSLDVTGRYIPSLIPILHEKKELLSNEDLNFIDYLYDFVLKDSNTEPISLTTDQLDLFKKYL
ncbi:hypothetical protein SNEBB_010752 [Seison nebaliae]|nr:hypothetical protein SNEBB_010752 [Seison nebaliae]